MGVLSCSSTKVRFCHADAHSILVAPTLLVIPTQEESSALNMRSLSLLSEAITAVEQEKKKDKGQVEGKEDASVM